MLKQIYLILISTIAFVVIYTLVVIGRPAYQLISMVDYFQNGDPEAQAKFDKMMNDPTYASPLNPYPRYFVAINGHIAPALAKKVGVVFTYGYETHNENCQYIVDDSGGLKADRFKNFDAKATPDHQGNFKVKIPIDYYEPGKCKWGMDVVLFDIEPNEKYGVSGDTGGLVVSFKKEYGLPIVTSFNKNGIVKCDKSMMCDFNHRQEEPRALPDKSYVYQLNILEKVTNT